MRVVAFVFILMQGQPGTRLVPESPLNYQFFGRDYQDGLPDSALPLCVVRRKAGNIDIRVEPELIEQIMPGVGNTDWFQAGSAAIVHMIELFLADELPDACGEGY